MENNFTTNYYVTLTAIYMCLKNFSNNCICKRVITYGLIDSVVSDNHDFYKYISSFNQDYSNYHNYLDLLKIIN